VIVAAAGDIACDPQSSRYLDGRGTSSECRHAATARLLDGRRLDAVLPLGDLQYDAGLAAAFEAAYGTTWGRYRAISRPTPGNHEYRTRGARAYFDYFGRLAGPAGRGYYSYDLGRWHLISLNSNCGAAGGCDSPSRQGRWLAADLAAHPRQCTLAYLHHPRWSDGEHGDTEAVGPLFEALHAAGVDVVLAGHDHIYQRFPPRAADGSSDPARGLRQFVVGTGGKEHYRITSPAPGSVANDDTFGVLVLGLYSDGYTWEFVPEAGGTFTDTGSAPCH
jgi:hypothetical protein